MAAGVRCSRMRADDRINGMTLATIMPAMNMEQMASARVQPKK